MVLGIMTAVAACPAIIGTTEAVREGQRKNAKDRHRGRRVNLVASCRTALGAKFRSLLDGGLIMLRNNNLYVDAAPEEELEFLKPSGHPFTGYFLEHPVEKWGHRGEGLVSTIMPDPPQLNWIYVDRDTHEIKYGTKIEAADHLLGPWDVSGLEKRLTFDGWEGFMAVKQEPDVWQLYFDVDDDGLRSCGVGGKRIVEIELGRRERRKPHEAKDDRDYI